MCQLPDLLRCVHALVAKVASSVLTPLLPMAQRGWLDVGGSSFEALVPKVPFDGTNNEEPARK